MRAIICGGVEYPTIVRCAMDREVSIARVQYALQVTGMLDGFPISYADPDPVRGECVAPRVVHSSGEPLLLAGYCTHRLGAYLGGRY